jgi:hypothetical protein
MTRKDAEANRDARMPGFDIKITPDTPATLLTYAPVRGHDDERKATQQGSFFLKQKL